MSSADPTKLLPPEQWFHCPVCNVKLDASTQVTHRTGRTTPGVGDYSMCLYCETVIRLREDLLWEPVEEGTVPPELVVARVTLRAFKEKNPDAFKTKGVQS